MTDKEKIKVIIQQYANKGEILLEESYAKGEHASTTGYWDGYTDCAKLLLKEIDSLQEEAVKIKKGCKYRCLSDMVNKDTGNIAFIGDKIYLAPKDNTLVSEENGWLCDTSENASNFELVEEPVSEDLEKEVDEYILDNFDDAEGRVYVLQCARHFAEWQKQQMMKTAVDGKIYETQARSKLKATTIGKISPLDYSVGDKVRIIIIKENNK